MFHILKIVSFIFHTVCLMYNPIAIKNSNNSSNANWTLKEKSKATFSKLNKYMNETLNQNFITAQDYFATKLLAIIQLKAHKTVAFAKYSSREIELLTKTSSKPGADKASKFLEKFAKKQKDF